MASTPNQFAVASALDRASATATGDMVTVMENLLGLSSQSAESAYDRMAGLTHTALTVVTFSSFNQYLGIVAGRMGGFISGEPSRADTGFSLFAW